MKNIDNYSVIGIQSDFDKSYRLFHVFRENPFKMIGHARLKCESTDEHEIAQQLIAEVCGVGFLRS